MASAVWRMMVSLMLQWNLFQLFQPMGGVVARPLFKATAGWRARKKQAAKRPIRRTTKLGALRVRETMSGKVGWTVTNHNGPEGRQSIFVVGAGRAQKREKKVQPPFGG